MRGVYDIVGGGGGGSGCVSPSSAIVTCRPIYYGPQRPLPRVILISLAKKDFFDEMYSSFLSTLRGKATVHEATTLAQAKEAFAVRPTAVIFTDEAIASSSSSINELQALATRYVRAGGTVIIGGHFSSFTPPLRLQPLFATFGLPWQAGSYHREDFFLNHNSISRGNNGFGYGFGKQALPSSNSSRLPAFCSVKALHVSNVARGDSVYLSAGRAASGEVGETPVALAEVGRGKVGYIGDVNAEAEMTDVVLAMCGLS